MPNYSEYKCGVCLLVCDRLRLFVKRTSFSTMANPNKIIRSRTKVWICNRCLDTDEDWNAPPYAGPGHKSAAQERIDQRKAAANDKLDPGSSPSA